MLSQDLLCATDLTPAADRAVRAALLIAERLGSKVTLLHVLNKDERTVAGKNKVLETMAAQAEKVDAELIYRTYCTTCHGLAGDGKGHGEHGPLGHAVGKTVGEPDL